MSENRKSYLSCFVKQMPLHINCSISFTSFRSLERVHQVLKEISMRQEEEEEAEAEAEEKDSAGENILAKFFEDTFAESDSAEGIEESQEEGQEEEEEEEVTGNTSTTCNDATVEEEDEVDEEKALAKSLNLEIATFLQKLPARQETIVFEEQ